MYLGRNARRKLDSASGLGREPADVDVHVAHLLRFTLVHEANIDLWGVNTPADVAGGMNNSLCPPVSLHLPERAHPPMNSPPQISQILSTAQTADLQRRRLRYLAKLRLPYTNASVSLHTSTTRYETSTHSTSGCSTRGSCTIFGCWLAGSISKMAVKYSTSGALAMGDCKRGMPSLVAEPRAREKGLESTHAA